jgi:hypothetical protein
MGYQGINIFVSSSFLSARVFLSTRNIVGVTIFTWGSIWGYNVCVVTEFEISVLEVNCKKQYPEISNYLPHFAGACVGIS